MIPPEHLRRHAQHAFTALNPLVLEGLPILSRRNMLKASIAGMAGLTVPRLLQARAEAAQQAQSISRKSVILLWMTGGPSHIDTLDPKPTRPIENRGPFGVTATKVPGITICEHLPKLAGMMDRFSILRSVDAMGSNHEPNTVFQTGNPLAAPRVNREGRLYPAIGAMVSKHHGANHPSMPGYAAFMKSSSHLAYAGYLGKRYDPFIINTAAKLPIYTDVGVDTGSMTNADLFRMPAGLTMERIGERQQLLASFDQMNRKLDASGTMDVMDYYGQQAVEMIAGRRAQEALDITREPQAIRDRYGKHLWCQQALLARRLVESGVAFVTLDLSYHGASGTWDTHGDNIPPYGGIKKGLGPLLPLFDHLVTTLVDDLHQRGLSDEVLVLAMGEFGRSPQTGTQGSTDGRNHWPVVTSALMAGGGLNHGQVIGATEADGGRIKERPITPGDLAATIYRHFDIAQDVTYTDNTGRPRFAVENGTPIRELVG